MTSNASTCPIREITALDSDLSATKIDAWNLAGPRTFYRSNQESVIEHVPDTEEADETTSISVRPMIDFTQAIGQSASVLVNTYPLMLWPVPHHGGVLGKAITIGDWVTVPNDEAVTQNRFYQTVSVADSSDILQGNTTSKQDIRTTDNSTSTSLSAGDAIQDIRRWLDGVVYLDLEEEVSDKLTEEVQNLIRRHGDLAVCEFNYLIHNGEMVVELAEFVLRVLGGMNHAITHKYRRWTLKQVLLHSSSPRLRDAANIGLALMDDPESIECLRTAIENEPSAFLRELLAKTLAQFEKTKNAATLETNYT